MSGRRPLGRTDMEYDIPKTVTPENVKAALVTLGIGTEVPVRSIHMEPGLIELSVGPNNDIQKRVMIVASK